MSDTNTPMTQAEHDQWVREQFQRANKHLAENGVLFDSVVVEESRYLAPYVAVWKIKSQQGKYFWVLSGDLPADYIPFDTAEDVRNALKHFSLSWQLKAENIISTNGIDETQQNYAKLLADRAISLYQLSEQQELWA
ncbi:MAG: DUF4826 family protein [Glaciecola sp.]|jgi:hypothetical protein|nr:DUF4826 family protein [Glaciecola sp.]MDG2098077.1 DUF4826 family protein [Glaciecola sp.]